MTTFNIGDQVIRIQSTRMSSGCPAGTPGVVIRAYSEDTTIRRDDNGREWVCMSGTLQLIEGGVIHFTKRQAALFGLTDDLLAYRELR